MSQSFRWIRYRANFDLILSTFFWFEILISYVSSFPAVVNSHHRRYTGPYSFVLPYKQQCRRPRLASKYYLVPWMQEGCVYLDQRACYCQEREWALFNHCSWNHWVLGVNHLNLGHGLMGGSRNLTILRACNIIFKF